MGTGHQYLPKSVIHMRGHFYHFLYTVSHARKLWRKSMTLTSTMTQYSCMETSCKSFVNVCTHEVFFHMDSSVMPVVATAAAAITTRISRLTLLSSNSPCNYTTPKCFLLAQSHGHMPLSKQTPFKEMSKSDLTENFRVMGQLH